MQHQLQRYTRIVLLNLLITALIGVALRYKIAWSFPILDQKHLLHGHSHFAFAGWISQALMILLVNYLCTKKGEEIFRKYKWMLNANLVTAYGMLITFPVQGYGFFSISFSTLSIFVSYIFAVSYWKDLSGLDKKNVSHWWMKAALLFNALSSLGAFSLALMMATKTIHQNWYLAAVYFFLHFQYNGWFFFACTGLAFATILQNIPVSTSKKIFWLFAGACIPAYILSALWLPIPKFTYYIVVAAAVAQVAGWLILISNGFKEYKQLQQAVSRPVRIIMMLSGIALTIKILLQLGSVIPSLSTLAFGFRPVIIGYLHLILLGVITLFLLGFLVHVKLIQAGKLALTGITVFISGVIINELLLAVQGAAAMTYTPLQYINQLLFAAGLVMFSGIVLLNLSQKRSK